MIEWIRVSSRHCSKIDLKDGKGWQSFHLQRTDNNLRSIFKLCSGKMKIWVLASSPLPVEKISVITVTVIDFLP
jgi:hypothetical protein